MQFSRPAAMQSSRPWYESVGGKSRPRMTGAKFRHVLCKVQPAVLCAGGGSLGRTPGDAMLVYLSVYRYETPAISRLPRSMRTWAKLRRKIQDPYQTPGGGAVAGAGAEQREPPPAKFVFSRPSTLRGGVPAPTERPEQCPGSAAISGASMPRRRLSRTGSRSSGGRTSPEVDAEQILEQEAHDHADVVFTTSIRMRPACLKVAVSTPKPTF